MLPGGHGPALLISSLANPSTHSSAESSADRKRSEASGHRHESTEPYRETHSHKTPCELLLMCKPCNTDSPFRSVKDLEFDQ